jgi:hypothetical protein
MSGAPRKGRRLSVLRRNVEEMRGLWSLAAGAILL